MSFQKSLKSWIAKCSSGKSLLMSIAFAVLFSFGAKSAAMSGTYTICASGCNYASFTDAVSALSSNGVNAAVTFNVSTGNYNEAITVGSITGASSTNTITFKGAGKGSTRIYNALSSNSAVIYMSYAKYVTFQDMTVEYATTSPSSKYTVYLYYSDNNTFKNCKIKAPTVTSFTYVYNVYNSYSKYNTFDGNIMTGGFYGLYNYGGYGNTTYGMHTFKNNRMTNAYYYLVYDYGSYSDNWTGNYMDSIGYQYGAGFYGYYMCGTTFTNNQVPATGAYYGCAFWYAQQSSSTNPFRVENNLFGPFSNHYYGVVLYNYTTSSNVFFRHNTIVSTSSNGYLFYGYWASTGAMDFSNNILYRKASGYLAYFYNFNQFTNLDGNDLMSGTASNPGFSIYCGTTYSSLSQWKTDAAVSNSKFAVNDVQVEPNFKSATDLHVDQNKTNPYSPFCGITKDIDGDVRCLLFPTTGADESSYGKGKFKANFFGPDTVYVNSPATYNNTAKLGMPMIHHWYVNGVWASDSIDLVTNNLTGPTSTIKLVTEGCAGKDSITKTIIVVKPSAVPNTDFIANTNSILQGDVVNFTDLSDNGPSAWKWDISPKTCYDPIMGSIPAFSFYPSDSAQNPKVKFFCSGKFTVCMTASNVVGSGKQVCKSAYINVIPTVNMCDVSISRESSGFLFDDGGPTKGVGSHYPTACGLLLDPCASVTYLVIDNFEMWCTMDYLRIYDGKDNTGKVINGTMGSKQCTTNSGFYGGPGFTGGAGTCYAGTGLKCEPIKGDTFIATTGKMYIEYSAYYGNYYPAAGFEAHWWSKAKTATAPTAKFDAPDSVCTNNLVEFVNKSTGAELQYYWDLDGDITNGFEDNTANPSWPYFSSGPVDVTLIVINCGGADTFTKTINIYNPNIPKAAFSADNVTPGTNEIVELTSKVVDCVDNYIWTIWNDKGDVANFVNGTSMYSAVAQVTFNDTGCYHVKLKVLNISGEDSLTAKCYIRVKNPYCIPGVSKSIPDIGISKVTFNQINQSSTQGIDGYQNFTGSVTGRTTAEIGVKYDLTVSRNTPMYNPMTRTAWIDWNGDADFDDAGEMIGTEKNKLTASWVINIQIPSTAKLGATTMRIACNYGSFSNKVCGGNKNGEYEDYRLYINPDITPPVITLSGPDTVYMEQGDTYKDSGYVAIDNLDGNITPKVVITVAPKFNNLIPNTYTFSYNVKDAAGNAAMTKKRIVIVKPDKVGPKIVLYGNENDTVEVFNSYTDPGVASAYDLVDGNLLSQVVTSGTVNTNVVGVYQITYSVSDFSGNSTVKIRYVNVVDTIAPVFVMKGTDTVYHAVNTTYVDAGYTVTDNYWSGVDITVNMSSNVNAKVLGTYKVIYTVEDKSGNKGGPFERIVIVLDNQGPTITLNGNMTETIEGNTVYTDPGYTVSDNYDKGTIVVTVAGTYHVAFDPSMKATALGTYTITYTASDATGNKTIVTRTINVVDTKKPVITLVGSPTLSVCRWDTYKDAGYTVSDNFSDSANITVKMSNSVSTSLDGLQSFRYIATDASGNKSYSDYRYILVKTIEQCGGNYLGINDKNSKENVVRVYPNPNNGQFNIQVNLPKSEMVQITVTNMVGQQVANVKNGVMNTETVNVNLSNQASGIYFINVQTPTQTIVRKVTITR